MRIVIVVCHFHKMFGLLVTILCLPFTLISSVSSVLCGALAYLLGFATIIKGSFAALMMSLAATYKILLPVVSVLQSLAATFANTMLL